MNKKQEKRETGNGERKTENGERKTENGKRKTENGERKTENGERKTENGKRKTENGERKTENGERRTENGEPKTENGSQKLKASIPYPVSRIENPNSKSQIPNPRIQIPESKADGIQPQCSSGSTLRSDIENPKSKIQIPESKSQNPESNIEKTSSIQLSKAKSRLAGHPVEQSEIPLGGTSSIEHPASSIQYRASSIQHRASSIEKSPLFGKTPDELKQIVSEIGLPAFTAKQIADWLYKKEVSSIEEMTNLSKKARELLSVNYDFGLIQPLKVQESKDGTKKYLFPTLHNKFIETAMIPDKERVTVCVSSQVGCKMGCLFCMTGKQGFNGQLSAGEIVNQIRSISEYNQVTNIVYMGMGEPFDNLNEVLKSIEILTAEWGYAMSPRRITVSSIGIIPGLRRFLNESNCNVAISLHTPFDSEREKLMPVQIAYPIEKVLAEIRSFTFDNQRKLSFEYIVFGGMNDTPAHVKEMARLLNGVKSHVNLIRFHPIPGTPLHPTNEDRLQEFKEQLNNKGILTTIRASRGMDIYAACGLLSTKAMGSVL